MSSNSLQLLAYTLVFLSILAGPARGQTEDGQSPKAKLIGETDLALEEAAIQSRIAIYSESTKGQIHAEDAQTIPSCRRSLYRSVVDTKFQRSTDEILCSILL